MALPVWGEFFKRVNANNEFAGYTEARFKEPPLHVSELLDCVGYVPYDYREPLPVIIEEEVVIEKPRLPTFIKPQWDRETTKTNKKRTNKRPRRPIISRPSTAKRDKPKKEKKGLFRGLFKRKKKKKKRN